MENGMYVHETKVRVLYAHTDKGGVVYYAKYLEFFEAGRAEYFRSLGRSYADFEEAGFFLTVVEAACKYLAPAKYDDLLTIRTQVTQVRRTRVDFEYEVAGPTGVTLCRGTTVLACISASTRKPCELPEEMRAMLEMHLNA
jgi:acyl-CoA thioester hydrolase